MKNHDQTPEPGKPQGRAQDRLAAAKGAFACSPGEAEARRLIQELQLHKIELEMQNEELLRTQEELKASWAQVDHRVVARTAELTRAIESLSAEVQVRYQAEQSLNGAFTELEVQRERLQAENAYLHLQLDQDSGQGFPGPSAAMAGLRSQIEAAAAQETPVLLLGEPGTGKGVAARAIHTRSARRNRPMVTVGCPAQPANQLGETLFGRAGGRDGRRRLGQFDLADQGSLYLSELGTLPPGLQARLVSEIQQRGSVPPGSPATVRPEVRIIAATNRDLGEEVRAGRFLEDLAACLGICVIPVPPLREHLEDIPSLVAHFMARYNRTLGKAIVTVSDRAMERLMAKAWPGNVKELRGVIELAMITSKGPSLELPERMNPQPE